MFMLIERPSLDCQDCGVHVRTLSAAEAQLVAAHPYNYIVYCPRCQAELREELLNG